MTKQVGVILLVVGIGLLMWGFQLNDAFSSRLHRAFTGSFTDKTAAVLIAGGVCVALGLYNLAAGGKK